MELASNRPKITDAASRAGVPSSFFVGGLFLDAEIEMCVDSGIRGLSPAEQSAIRSTMQRDHSFRPALRSIACSVSLVLSSAKTMDSDRDFADSVGLIATTDLSRASGAVGAFVLRLLRAGFEDVPFGVEGEDMTVPVDRVQRRLERLISLLKGRLATGTSTSREQS